MAAIVRLKTGSGRASGYIIKTMPLDTDGRRYADNIFNNSFEDIANDHTRQTAEIREDFAMRGQIASGPYVVALGRAVVDQIRRLAQARADSLLKAYERSGLPFDEAAVHEITAEVTNLCDSQQHHALLHVGQVVQQTFGVQSPAPGLQQAVTADIQREISSIISRTQRDLRIRRDEVILEEKRVRKAYAAGLGKEWDVFVCHASEDKEDFVRPLARSLQDSGLKIWYDESTIKVGDSLRATIDEGLSRSRFGIVVLSTNFFSKKWPQQELDGLVSREVAGVKVVLPIWHNISFDEVCRNSPTLAGRFAAKSSDGLASVVRQLRGAMGL